MLTGLILSGLLAVAPQLPPSTTSSAPSPPQKPDPAFSQLFQTVRQDVTQPAVRTGPRKKVVCGMTLLLVGPEGDTGMAKPAPKDHITYTMRRYPPPACGKDDEKR